MGYWGEGECEAYDGCTSSPASELCCAILWTLILPLSVLGIVYMSNNLLPQHLLPQVVVTLFFRRSFDNLFLCMSNGHIHQL